MTTTPKTSSARGAPLSVREYEPLARELLDPVHHDYFAGGAHEHADRATDDRDPRGRGTRRSGR